MSTKPIFTGSDWTLDKIQEVWNVIHRIAKEKYGLEYPEPQIEVVTARQMLHYHSLNGLPSFYDHWSQGKAYMSMHEKYVRGKSNLAYETIINSDPALCYILENNSMTMQTLVLAHAAVGHGSFFKINECFKTWTNPKAVLAHAKFAKQYIRECEQKYGEQKVESLLDAAHSLQNLSIDKYPRNRIKREEELQKIEVERREYFEKMYNEMWDTVPKKKSKVSTKTAFEKGDADFPWPFPEENVLYFIEQNSPSLEPWEKKVLGIVKEFAQYFYPQMQTKVMNEGWASFWHYTIMHDLYEEGYITVGSMFEFLDSHTAVTSDWVGGSTELTPAFNPYHLGFRVFQKIRQVCEFPSAKDKEEFPDIAGSDWLSTIKEVAANYVDSSFLGQFLSSDLIDEFGLAVLIKEKEPDKVDVDLGLNGFYGFAKALLKMSNRVQYNFTEIQRHQALKEIRKALSEAFSIANLFPTIEVVGCSMKGGRTLHLQHTPYAGQALHEDTLIACLKAIHRLWAYPIELYTIDSEGRPTVRSRKFI